LKQLQSPLADSVHRCHVSLQSQSLTETDRCDRGKAKAHHGERFTDDDMIPKIVEGLHGKHIVDVCVGPSHFLAVTKSGAVYSWGYNEHGQLGHHHSSPMDILTKPTRVSASTIAAGCSVAVHCGPLQVRLLVNVVLILFFWLYFCGFMFCARRRLGSVPGF